MLNVLDWLVESVANKKYFEISVRIIAMEWTMSLTEMSKYFLSATNFRGSYIYSSMNEKPIFFKSETFLSGVNISTSYLQPY